MASSSHFQLGRLAFTWDLDKYELNVRNHGITFEEAATTWMDSCAIEAFDEEHSDHEDRWLRIGMSLRGALLVTWSMERSTRTSVVIRIFGARRATAKEQNLYDQERKK
ncbi:MAG: BrnT family toxin [Polyangiaceae bacterium]|nr:BrnT family toxin [Polyangiaceae bacterium]